MESLKIQEQLEMNYDELVGHLLEKYGAAQYDYFVNEKCRSKHKKITRGTEGLICHHIDEDKAILLGNRDFAILSPFDYQKADRLVYCNILEHLILHIKIFEKTRDNKDEKKLGYRGAVVYIVPKINDYFNGNSLEKEWERTAFNLIKANFDDYINVINYFIKITDSNPKQNMSINIELLSLGTDCLPVKIVYSKLKKEKLNNTKNTEK